jgi:proteic killer suppression protein
LADGLPSPRALLTEAELGQAGDRLVQAYALWPTGKRKLETIWSPQRAPELQPWIPGRSSSAIDAVASSSGAVARHGSSRIALAVCTIECHTSSPWSCGMIVNFRDDWLRDFFVEDVRSKKIPPDLERRLFRKIQMIDDATTDQDLRVPPSNHFEKLRGNLEGFHSIRVNKQWRLIFLWNGRKGEATGVYLDDHSYR